MDDEDVDLLNKLMAFDTTQTMRQVDRNFIRHLQAVHVEGGKPISEMWPCHRERLYELEAN